MRHNHYTQSTSPDDMQNFEFAWRMPPYIVSYHKPQHHYWLAAVLAAALLSVVVL